MSKFTLVIFLLFVSFSSVLAYDPIKGKDHPFSLQITNPLSGASKFGGVLELRLWSSSFNIGLNTYYGVYKGKQYKFEYEKYIRTNRRNEYFWYIKAYGGEALYVSEKLAMFGDKTHVQVGPFDYYGGGAGFGRRFNFNHICLLVNAGLKYTALPENESDEDREYFRVFYATGPGSIIDLNFRLGYQF